MAQTPLIKFCLYCPHKYFDTSVTKCKACGGVLKRVRISDPVPMEESRREELTEAILCCPTISCPVWKVNTKAELPKQETQPTVEAPRCHECKEILEVATIYLWLDKIGSPTPQDLAEFLQNSERLMERAATAKGVGLKSKDALTLLDQAIHEMSGVTFNILEDWARQNIQPHVKRGTVSERARYAALEAAREWGIDESLATVVFDKLAPPREITFPLEPSEQFSDDNSARQEQSPREAATPAVTDTTPAVTEVSKTVIPVVEVDSKPGANTAHNPVSQAAATPQVATTPQAGVMPQAAVIPQAAAVLDENAGDADSNPYQFFPTLLRAANEVTPWEYFKKTLLPLLYLIQQHMVISIVVSMVLFIAFVIGIVSGVIEIAEYFRTAPDRKPNRPPILRTIKCLVDPVEAGKPFLLEADYDDDQLPEKLTFIWDVKEEGVTGVENKPVIKLNANSLKARGGIVLLHVTLKIRDPNGLESVERERIVTVIANRPPNFNFAEISPTTVLPGMDVLLTAQYTDLDGDKVIYEWASYPQANIKKIAEDGSHVRLETRGFNPEKSRDMPVEISLTVTDGIANIVQKHLIKVKSPESAKSTEARLSLTTPPPPTRFKLHMCQADKDFVEQIGETVDLNALATDSHADNLEYKWETNAGRIHPQHGEHVTLYTEGINPSTKIIKVTMTVTNGSGGSISHNIPIKVKLPAPPALPVPEPTTHPLPTQEIKPNSNSRAAMIP